MTDIIDPSYFKELGATDPQLLSRNDRCSYDKELRQYSLTVWGDRYLIDAGGIKIDNLGSSNNQAPHDYFYLLVMYYLLRAKDIQLSGEWVSEKDMPGGSAFFRGPHLIPTDIISNHFENDLEKFQMRCQELGGIPINMADAAYKFSLTPDISVAVLYWIGDEDFPAEAKILHDRSIAELLSLDIIYVLAVGVCSRVGKAK